MELKLVVTRLMEHDFIDHLIVISSRLHYKKVYELWQSIQHLDMFFGGYEGDLNASYDEKQDIIDFKDEHGSLMFYVSM